MGDNCFAIQDSGLGAEQVRTGNGARCYFAIGGFGQGGTSVAGAAVCGVNSLQQDNHADRNTVAACFDGFIRAGVGWKPQIFPDLLAVRLEHGKWQRGSGDISGFRNPLADRLDDHQILFIHPHHAGKIGVHAIESTRLDGKKIGAQFIERLLPSQR